MIELRCDRHLHAKVNGDVIEVKCRWCDRFHYWVIVDGRPEPVEHEAMESDRYYEIHELQRIYHEAMRDQQAKAATGPQVRGTG